jgi:RNA polymerase sigma-70 factor (ECF subfamily)
VEDKPVIERFLSTRSEEAYCALFESVCARVHRYFRMRGLDAATAEELTQNVMLKVYRQAGELREPEHFFGWLFAIARNEMISYWRGARVRIETVAIDTLPTELIDLPADHDELHANLQLSGWLRELEPGERSLVVLRFVEGLSYEELALALGLPLGTVKWRLFSARKKIAALLHGENPAWSRQ